MHQLFPVGSTTRDIVQLDDFERFPAGIAQWKPFAAYVTDEHPFLDEQKLTMKNRVGSTSPAEENISDARDGQKQKLLSCREIAENLSLSKTSVFRLLKRENVTHAYLGTGKSGAVRFPKDEVDAVIQRRSIRPRQTL
jgi:predicted DNA-binding transcriptional regulator AlpA